MMGQLLMVNPRRGFGLETPQVKSAVSSGLWTAAAADPEPISKIALTAAAFFTQLFGFGYDPQKLQDTAITEAFRIGANGLWNDLTGDNLPVNCMPGQCGKQNTAIFTASRFPEVPYPAGRPGTDIDQYIAALQVAIADGRSKLVRPESVAGFDQNANYFLTMLGQAKQLRAQQTVFDPGSVSSITQGFEALVENVVPGQGKSIVSLLPWVIGAYAVYKWVL